MEKANIIRSIPGWSDSAKTPILDQLELDPYGCFGRFVERKSPLLNIILQQNSFHTIECLNKVLPSEVKHNKKWTGVYILCIGYRLELFFFWQKYLWIYDYDLLGRRWRQRTHHICMYLEFCG